MNQPTSTEERIAHYAAACKGNLTRALLMALNDGFDFGHVVNALGKDGVKITFRCIVSGYIEHGKVTDAGRAYLEKGADA